MRNIKSTRNRTTATIRYGHVDGHIDEYKYLLFTQMTLEQQMNLECDKEKGGSSRGKHKCNYQVWKTQLLPGEHAVVFVRGKKFTNDLSKAIWLEASREKAKEFLVNKCKWPAE